MKPEQVVAWGAIAVIAMMLVQSLDLGDEWEIAVNWSDKQCDSRKMGNDYALICLHYKSIYERGYWAHIRSYVTVTGIKDKLFRQCPYGSVCGERFDFCVNGLIYYVIPLGSLLLFMHVFKNLVWSVISSVSVGNALSFLFSNPAEPKQLFTPQQLKDV